MAIDNITQTISTLPPAGRRGIDVQTQFVIKQEDFQDHLQGTTVSELNTLKDQLNLRIGEINSTATTMNGYAGTASAGASTATTKAGEASTSASEALTSRNQAETFKNNALSSATKASQWADNNYNVEVETGKYSAKHWATVAQSTSGEDTKGSDIASATTTIIGTAGLGGYIHITGTATITSFGTAANAGVKRTLIFDNALTITNGANLICAGGVDIITVANTIVSVVAETTTQWRVEYVIHPSVSFAELGYLDGVTSSIQNQINSKANIASPAFTGNPTAPTQTAGDNSTKLATTAYVDNGQASNATPAGTIITFASATAPTGYLKANGALLSRTTYSALFAAIGTTFGIGNGSTTFALPDLRGYFARAWDDGRGIDVGRVFGSNQVDDFKSHTHSGSAHNSGTGYGHTSGDIWNFSSLGGVGYTGGSETRPKNIALLHCIKY